MGPNQGTIKELWNLPSQIVTIVAGDRFNPVKSYEMLGDRTVSLPPEQVIHLKYWTPQYESGTFLYGLSPIRAGRRVVSKSNASYDSSVASFQNMGASGFVSGDSSGNPDYPLTPEQAEEIEDRMARKTGPRNRGKFLVTSAGLKWQQVGMSPVDLNIIESDKMDLRTLCNIFHCPSELFNDPATKVYATTKEAGSAVYTNAVIPALVPFRDALNQKIKGRYKQNLFIDFDTSMISELQDDIQHISTAIVNCWWLKPNERRTLMSFEEDQENPMMDEYWMPVNTVPMSIAMNGPVTPQGQIDNAALAAAGKALGLDDYKQK
jgi:HK97 family phage portal protein